MAQIHQSHVGLIGTRQGANLEQEPWLLHAEQEEKEEQEEEQEEDDEEEQKEEEEQVEQEEQELSHTPPASGRCPEATEEEGEDECEHQRWLFQKIIIQDL